jgi:hypothetical protein
MSTSKSLKPMDFTNQSVINLIQIGNGEYWWRSEKITDKKASIRYFNKLREEFFKQFGIGLSMGAIYYAGGYYQSKTDDVILLAKILENIKSESILIRKILTIMGYDWAGYFHDQFPNTQIDSVDINPAQFVESGPEAAEFGNVYLADISYEPITNVLLQQCKPDLLYLSDALQCFNDSQLEGLARCLLKSKVQVVISAEEIGRAKFGFKNGLEPLVNNIGSEYSYSTKAANGSSSKHKFHIFQHL